METSRAEFGPDNSRESAESAAKLEQLGEQLAEKLRAEMDPDYGKDFEAPKKFDNEDEKNRQAELDAAASEIKTQLDDISESISNATQQLAALPLTPEQQALLVRINQLIAEREQTRDASKRSVIDADIESTTKQLAALPVTDEQGGLLDDILALMDEREKTELKLADIYRSRTQ